MGKINIENLEFGAQEIGSVANTLIELADELSIKIDRIKKYNAVVKGYDGQKTTDTTYKDLTTNNVLKRHHYSYWAKISGADDIEDDIENIEKLIEVFLDTADYFTSNASHLEDIAAEVRESVSTMEGLITSAGTTSQAIDFSLVTLYSHGDSQVFDENGNHLDDEAAKKQLGISDDNLPNSISYKYDETRGMYQVIVDGQETNAYVSALAAANQKRSEYKQVTGYDINDKKNDYVGDYNVDTYSKTVDHVVDASLASATAIGSDLVHATYERNNLSANSDTIPNNVNGSKVTAENSVYITEDGQSYAAYKDEDGNLYYWDASKQKFEEVSSGAIQDGTAVVADGTVAAINGAESAATLNSISASAGENVELSTDNNNQTLISGEPNVYYSEELDKELKGYLLTNNSDKSAMSNAYNKLSEQAKLVVDGKANVITDSSDLAYYKQDIYVPKGKHLYINNQKLNGTDYTFRYDDDTDTYRIVMSNGKLSYTNYSIGEMQNSRID